MPCVSILEAAFAGNGWHVSVSSITKRFSLAERGPADWSVLSQVREGLDRELPWILFTHFGVAQAVLEEGLSSTPGKHIIWQGCVIFIFFYFFVVLEMMNPVSTLHLLVGKKNTPVLDVHTSFPGVQWNPFVVVYLVFLWLGQIRV